MSRRCGATTRARRSSPAPLTRFLGGLPAAALLAVVAPVHAAAQSRTVVAAGVEFQRMGFSDAGAVGTDALTLLTTSWAARFAASPTVDVSVSGNWARAEETNPAGGTRSLAGLTDTQLEATLRLAGGDVALTGMLALPTGSPALELGEIEVAARIASDLLPFRISNWGSGGGAGARVALARRFGGVGAGVSAGYFVGREFTPLGFADTEYRPGSSLVIRGVLDGNVGRAGKASLQLTVRTYGHDQQDGGDAFQAGARTQALASYAFRVGTRSSAVLYAGALHRAEGTSESSIIGIGARTLVTAGGSGRFQVGGVRLIPAADVRLVTASDGIDQGYELGLGGRAEVTRGSVVLVPEARLHLGRLALLRDVAESSYLGLDVGFTVRLRP